MPTQLLWRTELASVRGRRLVVRKRANGATGHTEGPPRLGTLHEQQAFT